MAKSGVSPARLTVPRENGHARAGGNGLPQALAHPPSGILCLPLALGLLLMEIKDNN